MTRLRGWIAKHFVWSLLLGLVGTAGPAAAASATGTGCYIGAYIHQDPVAQGDIAVFEDLTGKKC